MVVPIDGLKQPPAELAVVDDLRPQRQAYRAIAVDDSPPIAAAKDTTPLRMLEVDQRLAAAVALLLFGIGAHVARR